MNIIIPMAGRGTRMRPHSITTPKPLIPIAGKAMVHRILEDITATSNEKIEDVVFIVGRFGEEAENALLKVANSLGAKGHIVYQDEPKGTAHALLCAKEFLKGNVFIAFADTLFKATFKIDTEKDAIIWTQKVENPEAFGVVTLDENGKIISFVEKPTTFVSDLAIIGVYYFKDGENLKNEMKYLIDNQIMQKGEYQLTDAMENMKEKGLGFYTGQVEEWLDCGNKDATLFTMERILEIKKSSEDLIHNTHTNENSVVIEPCFIGKNVVLKNSVIGPHVSLEEGSVVENAVISKSIIGKNSIVKNSIISKSLLGNNVACSSKSEELSLGDYSFKL
ncbi:MAG: NTP transferase domain-containing protein [Chitinophagaceae bacterium]|nr:NTP transferase domain-containing protein [Chitinophagaceae bacterium]